MKVLFVYKFLTVGGVETVLRARLESLARHGIDARCWFLADYGGASVFADVADRVHVGSVEQALAFVQDEQIDLVSTIDTEEVLPGLDTMPGAPAVVLEAHSAYLENLRYLEELSPRLVRRILVPSPSHRQLVEERTQGRWDVAVAPNPVSPAFLARLGVAPRHPVPLVAWLGRLDEHKNWRAFVRVAQRLGAAGVHAEFVVAGQPVEPSGADDLRAAATAAGVLPRLRWLCGLPHDRVPALLDDVRTSGGVVVVTSRGESFGMTVVEAMARSCTVVVPRTSPYDDFVDWDRSGVGYAPGDVSDAAHCVTTALQDAELRHRTGAAARRDVLERFAPDVAVAALATELRAALT